MSTWQMIWGLIEGSIGLAVVVVLAALFVIGLVGEILGRIDESHDKSKRRNPMPEEDGELEELFGGHYWKCGCGKVHHMTDVVCPEYVPKKQNDRTTSQNE